MKEVPTIILGEEMGSKTEMVSDDIINNILGYDSLNLFKLCCFLLVIFVIIVLIVNKYFIKNEI